MVPGPGMCTTTDGLLHPSTGKPRSSPAARWWRQAEPLPDATEAPTVHGGEAPSPFKNGDVIVMPAGVPPGSRKCLPPSLLHGEVLNSNPTWLNRAGPTMA